MGNTNLVLCDLVSFHHSQLWIWEMALGKLMKKRILEALW
jgi:hypothetical protein